MLAISQPVNAAPAAGKDAQKRQRSTRKPSPSSKSKAAQPESYASQDLASLVSLCAKKRKASKTAYKAAEEAGNTGDAAFQFEIAERGRVSMINAIINHPAASLADIVAKFSVIKEFAEEEDYLTNMNHTSQYSFTERMMWSIVGDLCSLPSSIPAIKAPQTECYASTIADEFRQAIDKVTPIEENPKYSPQRKDASVRLLSDQADMLMKAASFERASSPRGALFQISVAMGLVELAINNREWFPESDGLIDIPEGVDKLRHDIRRLLTSASQALAAITNVPGKEYCADYFLTPDPSNSWRTNMGRLNWQRPRRVYTAWYDDPEARLAETAPRLAEKTKRRIGRPSNRPPQPLLNIDQAAAELLDVRSCVVHTDGACEPNPGRGGWGVSIEANGQTLVELCGGDPSTTNNRMEMTAAIVALTVLPLACQVTLLSDSQYVINGMTIWSAGRKRKMRNGKKPVPNVDLWRTLDALADGRSITWRWVKGHNGHRGNERADHLASLAIRQSV